MKIPIFFLPTPPLSPSLSGTSLGFTADLDVGYQEVGSMGLLGKEPLAQRLPRASLRVLSLELPACLQAPNYAASSQAFRLFYHYFP